MSQAPFLAQATVVNMSDRDPALLEEMFQWIKQSNKYNKTKTLNKIVLVNLKVI